MSKAHSSKGTIKEIAGILSSIADGVMLEPATRDHHAAAFILQHRVMKARTHAQITLAAVSAVNCFKQVGDVDTESAIIAVMGGR
jgi:hypothetical protein